jgi:SulP family sulfate permease
MTALDATGLQALENLAQALQAAGRTLVLCGAREQPAMMMLAAEFHQHVGNRNICPNIEAALQRAAEIHRASAA